MPACYYPNNYSGYKVVNIQTDLNRYIINLERDTPSGWLKDSKKVTVEVFELDDEKVRIKVTDAEKQRYEVPFPHLNLSSSKQIDSSSLYLISLSDQGIVQISRKATQTVLFETDLRRLIFSDQFIQLSSKVPEKYLYGLGEHKDRFQKDLNWKQYTFFNRDGPPAFQKNLYGSHPFYLMVEKSGNQVHSHGVLLFNSNSMEVILQPTPAVTWRAIGGILDFYIFLGPASADVVRQNINLLGRPHMPPYWSLGFHLCRFGYKTLKTTRQTWKRTIDAKIPFDVQWNDIDYMYTRNDFTYNNESFDGFSNFVDEVHQKGMHYVLMFVSFFSTLFFNIIFNLVNFFFWRLLCIFRMLECPLEKLLVLMSLMIKASNLIFL